MLLIQRGKSGLAIEIAGFEHVPDVAAIDAAPLLGFAIDLNAQCDFVGSAANEFCHFRSAG